MLTGTSVWLCLIVHHGIITLLAQAGGNYHALGIDRGELSRSWHGQGGIITLLASTGGNYHALGIEAGCTRIRSTSTTIYTLSTNVMVIRLIPLSSSDFALFDPVKMLACFLEKVSNLKP